MRLYGANRTLGQLILAAMMFVPALGALLAGGELKGMGRKPRFRRNIRPFLIAAAVLFSHRKEETDTDGGIR